MTDAAANTQVFVITGPSGVGKGTLISLLRERHPGLGLSVSATTRAPRPGEVDGVSYHFLSPEQFAAKVDAGEFVEHADYSGNRYGTLRSELERHRETGGVVLEIELQGARQIRVSMPEAHQIFIAPPSAETLRKRLVGRGTDAPEEIERRLAVAEEELAARDEFAHVVVNDDLERAAGQLDAIVSGYHPPAR
ncbi:MAG: guanylate kinase [Actinobacteria bacterium]|nr:guanylate kinase [Actinomycetota bacterium]